MSAVMGPEGPQQGPPQGLLQQTDPKQEQASQSPITQKIVSGIMDGAPPKLRSSIDRIVTAGKRLMYDPQTHELMVKQLQTLQAGNEADRIAQGIAALISMIAEKSKVLMCDAIDFLAESGKIEVTEDLVAEATQELMGYVMQKLGIGPEQIAQAQAEGQAPPEQLPVEPPVQNQRGLLSGGA
jgi:Ni,Fe-hydrogenase maturation factor